MTPSSHLTEDLQIRLAERSYPIVFGHDLTHPIAERLQALKDQGRKVAVVTDRHLATRQAATIQRMIGDLPTWVIEPGEKAKSLAIFGQILDFLAQNKLDRAGVVVAVGGGVIGDLAGYAAASYLRGIDYLQVPTTLLAMVDSSVGGKTGINLNAGKNLVGAFHQPRGVFVGTGILDTLPPREFAAGMAEVIKYGLLGDPELFGDLERQPVTPGAPELPALVRRCCAIKARFVEQDERELLESGGRALLNLGHTFAHAIEQVAGYGVYLHGEAVAIGLCAAAMLSESLKLIGPEEVRRVTAVVAAHQLPVRLHSGLPLSALMDATARDKKVRAGERRFIVLRPLGHAEVRSGVDAGLAEACFRAVGAK